MYILLSVIILVVCIFTYNAGFTQTKPNCNSATDSMEIIKIVDKKGLLQIPQGYTLDEIQKYPSMSPKLIFDSEKCIWKVISKSYSAKNTGKCRRTNGCTVEITKVVLISAETKKIIKRKTTKIIYENHE